MLIRELEEKTALDRATIRYYEQEGLITPQRKANGYREYSDADCETLLKVKCLRQLGIPLEQIHGLFNGTTDLAVTVSAQIQVLEKQASNSSRAAEVCREIKEKGLTLETLDARYYLNELQNPPTQEHRPSPTNYRAALMLCYHPWRRILARAMDESFIWLILWFFPVVALRIRPIGTLVDVIIFLCTYLISIPLQALYLHRFGTTPGKWLMGIHIHNYDGGYLSFQDALKREWAVFRDGYGYHIPILNMIRLSKASRDYSEYWQSDWDENWEVEFDQFPDWKGFCYAFCLICYAALGFLLASQMAFPRYQGKLTPGEFAENLHYCYEVYIETYVDMFEYDKQGNIHPVVSEFFLGRFGERETESPISYETDSSGHITEIKYHQTWTEIKECIQLEEECGRFSVIAATYLASQRNAKYSEIKEDIRKLDQYLLEPSGEVEYKNLKIQWCFTGENTTVIEQGVTTMKRGEFLDLPPVYQIIKIDESKPGTMTLEYTITINP